MTMYATLQMDREIDPTRHDISIGGFEFCFRNGVNIGFDFNSSIANVQKNPTTIKFECDDLDCDSFPEAALLGMMLSDSEVKRIEEFYVYTGEREEPEINPEKILSLSFCVDERMIDIPGIIIQKYEFTR
ncbi:MAG: hypothetical protein UIH27_02170 [Ruminococcus sp.]|nr:hypothetical protein [Ruminococcus sp.]